MDNTWGKFNLYVWQQWSGFFRGIGGQHRLFTLFEVSFEYERLIERYRLLVSVFGLCIRLDVYRFFVWRSPFEK